MSTSELVTSLHLQKKAIIYIRQSTPHQQISNQESLRLQYALRERAQRLGWHAEDVEIIDADLGLTGASAQHRTGFQELVAKVTLGQVGLILSVDVTRLSRNCSDWYPLLDVCGYRGCLIADNDGIYDPGSANGRLLLGLKGQLSELELHTIRARMTAGLLGHQRRAVNSPSRSQSGWYVMLLTVSTKIPIRRFKIAWTWFLRPSCGCVRKASSWGSSTLKTWLCPDEIALETWSGKSRPWRSSCKSSRILPTREPLSTGAPAAFEDDPAALRSKQVRLPMEQWRIRVNDVYPAYISWQTFERIQAMLLDNYAEYDRNKTRGVPRPGAALLHGMVYCGECGHKLVVQYKGGTRYLCNFLRQKYRVPVCQHIPGDAVDPQIVQAFFQALSPIELDVYSRAVATQREETSQVSHAHQQHLERLRSEAALAERQFLRVDPDNRLVAAALEKRWNEALAQLKRVEEAEAQRGAPTLPLLSLSEELQTAFKAIGQHLPALWHQGLISQQQKKALLRCLIDKVVVHRPSPEWVQARLVWRGGESTTLKIPVPVGSLKDLAGAKEMERLVLERNAQGATDEVIGSRVNGTGLSLADAPLRPAQYRQGSSPQTSTISGSSSISSAPRSRLTHPDPTRQGT